MQGQCELHSPGLNKKIRWKQGAVKKHWNGHSALHFNLALLVGLLRTGSQI